MQCSSCGAKHHGDELICQWCGTLLTLTAEELERVERYRLHANTELLCVMFCDISGFTAIADRSLTQSQKILAIHMALTQGVIEQDKAGEIVNTAGDGILCVFSNPAVATERALALHAATSRYQAGGLADSVLADALHAAKLSPTPDPGDEHYALHTGLHLGLVTRGGRTSRDVFGHNVNIACRLCSLAGPGQTYMSEPVYDNARLIIGDRETLHWQMWKDQPIRGLTAPMTVVGVAESPYTTLHPPRGVSLERQHVENRARLKKRALTVGAAVLPVLLVIGIAVGLRMRAAHLATPPSETLPAASTPVANLPEAEQAAVQQLPAIAATTMDIIEDAPAPESADAPPSGEAGATPDAAAETPAGDGGQNGATGGVTEGSDLPASPPPTAGEQVQPASATTPASNEAVAPEQQQPGPKWLSLLGATLQREGQPIRLQNGPSYIRAKLKPIHVSGQYLIVIGVDQHLEASATLSLLIDGNCDGLLQSQQATPFYDFALEAGSPDSDHTPTRSLSVFNNRPGPEIKEFPAGRTGAFYENRGERTVWYFQVPASEVDGNQGKIGMQLRLFPEGPDSVEYRYPATSRGLHFQELNFP
jgi:class 3 adenylate cyclase